jgi:hypothetical protein
MQLKMRGIQSEYIGTLQPVQRPSYTAAMTMNVPEIPAPFQVP